MTMQSTHWCAGWSLNRWIRSARGRTNAVLLNASSHAPVRQGHLIRCLTSGRQRATSRGAEVVFQRTLASSTARLPLVSAS